MAGLDAGAAPSPPGPYHADESSNPTFHYSAVAFLSDGGAENATTEQADAPGTAPSRFGGGELIFGGPPGEGSGAVVVPRAGEAVLFSSGWEHPHHVAAVTRGTRLTIPMFFSTRPLGAQPRRPADVMPRDRALRRFGLEPTDANDLVRLWRDCWPSMFDDDAPSTEGTAANCAAVPFDERFWAQTFLGPFLRDGVNANSIDLERWTHAPDPALTPLEL